MDGVVTAVSRSPKHTLIKTNEDCIRLLIGLGVEGNAHSGARVKHRSRVARDPTQPNLRQVHLIHAELHDERGRAASPSRPGRSARTSRRAASIFWSCLPVRSCISGQQQSSK